MQRMAAKQVTTLKHLQTTKKGSGLALSLVLEETIGSLSPSSPFLGIFLSFLNPENSFPQLKGNLQD